MRLFSTLLTLACAATAFAAEVSPLAWPPITRECRPWAYNWWLGSAVDRTNLAHELRRYREGGLGGVHIIPIYGAKGAEARYLEYLSPQWMEMLSYAVSEGERHDLGVDMTTGTGWCFGGPNISREQGCWKMQTRVVEIPVGGKLAEPFDRNTLQALVAVASDRPRDETLSQVGQSFVDLKPKLNERGVAVWDTAGKAWKVHALTATPGGRAVKRAAPGGAGPMLNPFDAAVMKHYLERFTEALARHSGPRPRAMYHDSYEYDSGWVPDLPAAFARRRGYRLEDRLPAFCDTARASSDAGRVWCDFRETVSDLMIEDVFPQWTAWCRARGFLTRNQAHGSPANILDLYALADIPETEMFGRGKRDPLHSAFDASFQEGDRNPLICKFASSAAHVAGRRLVAAETGTWMAEHFCETLEELKCFTDLLLLSGVNHVIYHGCCYSPDDAAWPGWLFYASTEMNPRNPIWHDARALNAYIARCQSILQSGAPDNDVLLYWPIHDLWQTAPGALVHCTVHSHGWLDAQPLGRTARTLWTRGYGFDYVSDRLLATASAKAGEVTTAGGRYRAVLVPTTTHLPLETLRKLLALAEAGATVVFERRLPQDVPGLARLDERRAAFKQLLHPLAAAQRPATATSQLRVLNARYGANDTWIDVTKTVSDAVQNSRLSIRVDAPRPFPDPLKGVKKTLEVDYELDGVKRRQTALDRGVLAIGSEDVPQPLREVALGKGRVLVGELEEALSRAGVRRETLVDHAGALFIRRRHDAGRHYFIANQSTNLLSGWQTLATDAASAIVLDPMTGRAGAAPLKRDANGQPQVFLRLEPGHSLIVRTFTNQTDAGAEWKFQMPSQTSAPIPGPWKVRFIQGGPELPKEFETATLDSWTRNGDPQTECFGGTAVYSTTFDAPAGIGPWILDLGRVCHSARVRLNGKDLGTLFMRPYRLALENLQPQANRLEVEVTNLAANRIRDLDRRKVQWRVFHEINFVNIGYRPFDASDWPVAESGLLGPVRLLRAGTKLE